MKKDNQSFQTGGQTSLTPFYSEDIYEYKVINNLSVSPTSNDILFELKSQDKSSDSSKSKIWIKSLDNEEKENQFTFGPGNDKSPLWSPDGNYVAFLSDRDQGSFQLFVMNRNGGEAKKITSLKGSIISFDWSPEGKKILAISNVDKDIKPEDVSEEQWKKRPQVTTNCRYKNDAKGFILYSHTHIFEIDVEKEESIQITHGDYDVLELSISPNGEQFVYCRSREGQTHITDLWMHNLKTHQFEQITNDILTISTPSWSPDGKWVVAYGAQVEGRSISWPWRIDPIKKDVMGLGDEMAEISTFPLSKISKPAWSMDSKKFYLAVSIKGISEIAEIDIESGKMKTALTGERQICQVHLNGANLAFISQTIAEPEELYVFDLNSQKENKLTSVNNEWWSKKDAPSFKRVKFTIEENKIIEGWLIEGSDNNKPSPLLVDVHGGPHSMVEFGFAYHPYWYMLASKGWKILALNQEGSASYGLEFAESLRGKWGELDFPQILKAITTLQQEGSVDDRVAIAGKSYGGFMAAWAVGHSKIFKAAIVSAPVSNQESHASTSDSGFYVGAFYMNCELNSNRDYFRKHSTVTYCKNVETPTLVLQGEKDERCPKGQAEEFFSGIRQNNCPAELVIYPDGHHDLAEAGKPSHRIDYHSRVVEWCEKWIKTS